MVRGGALRRRSALCPLEHPAEPLLMSRWPHVLVNGCSLSLPLLNLTVDMSGSTPLLAIRADGASPLSEHFLCNRPAARTSLAPGISRFPRAWFLPCVRSHLGCQVCPLGQSVAVPSPRGGQSQLYVLSRLLPDTPHSRLPF